MGQVYRIKMVQPNLRLANSQYRCTVSVFLFFVFFFSSFFFSRSDPIRDKRHHQKLIKWLLMQDHGDCSFQFLLARRDYTARADQKLLLVAGLLSMLSFSFFFFFFFSSLAEH